MVLLNILLWVILPIAIILGTPILMVIWKTSQLIIKVTEIQPARLEDCPPTWLQTVQSEIEIAQGLGLEAVSYDWVTAGGEGDPLWSVILQSRQQDIHLCLVVHPSMTTQSSIEVTSYTFFEDGTSLLSSNSSLLQSQKFSPQRILNIQGWADLPTLFESHHKSLETLRIDKTALCLNAEEFCEAWQKHYLEEKDYLAKIGWIYWVEHHKSYRLSFKNTAKLTWCVWRQSQKQKTHPSDSKLNISSEVQLEQEVTEFLANKQRSEKVSSPKTRLGWLFLSLIAFIVAYAFQFSPQTLVIFVGALLLHEGGHVLAMWWFGYKDLKMLFIPFLGALATARNDNATLSEKVWISLAGPLPGLILGILIIFLHIWKYGSLGAWSFHGEWTLKASFILIGLNLFNLLPIYPLDGGQVANLLLFSRNAYIGVFFQGLGVLFLVLIGLAKPLFLAFATLVAITIPHNWQVARTRARLNQQLRHLDGSDQENFIREVFRQFQQPPYQDWPTPKKHLTALGLLDSHRENRAPWSTRVGLIIVYLVTLVLSFGSIIHALFPSPFAFRQLMASVMYSAQKVVNPGSGSTMNMARQQQNLMREMQAIQLQELNQELARNPRNAAAYFSRAGLSLHTQNLQAALADANQAIELNPKDANYYRLRGQIHTLMGQKQLAGEDQKYALNLTFQPKLQEAERLIQANPNSPGGYRLRGMARAGLMDFPGAINDYSQALKIDPNNTETLNLRGYLYVQQKLYTLALADVNRLIQLKPQHPEWYYLRSDIYEALGEDERAKADAAKANAIYDQMESAGE